jgi:ABC-type antimicrobial peptide transport system permease subunit
MELFELALMLPGLVFGKIALLLIAFSILLIYSLLQNSVDSKTRDYGIMRLCGLTKVQYVSLILIKAFLFVLPSIFLAYIASFPTLWWLLKY